MQDMDKVIDVAVEMKHVKFIGLHFHIGSQILDLSLIHIFGVSVCVYSQFLPETLTAFFSKDVAVVAMAAEYLRGYSICLLYTSCSIACHHCGRQLSNWNRG